MSFKSDLIAQRSADQFPLRLPDGMRGEIKVAAARNGRSMNTEILDRLAAYGAGGKTLRDEFAMAALTGLLASPHVQRWGGEPIAGESAFSAAAYAVADAMLAARQEGDA